MSTLKTNIIKDTNGVEMYLAKAWVNFNGTGTVAIRAAGNVSSITDNGTGFYTVNFTNPFADNNYAVVALCSNNSGQTGTRDVAIQTDSPPTTGNVSIMTGIAAGSREDVPYVNLTVFR